MELNEFIENYKEVFTEIIEGSFDKKAKELYGKKALESYNKVSPNYPNASRHRRGQDAESFVDPNHIFNKFTICQMDTENTDIYITNKIK